MDLNQNMRDLALKLVARFEGLRLHAYQDQVGVWTIGYGCTGPDIGPGLVWTQEQADAELGRRLDEFQAQMVPHIAVQPTDEQMAAMTSLCYNIGINGFLKSTVLRKLNAGDPAGSADAFLLWNKAGGQVNKGLDWRRHEERKIFLGTQS